MTIQDALAQSGLPHAEAEVLLSALLERDRSWLLAHPESRVPQEQLTQWRQWTERRRRGEPTAYITGWQAFYGRRFKTDPRVLIPRPSTEGLVDVALAYLTQPTDRTVELDSQIAGVSRIIRPGSPKIVVDLGTGSGCIAITVALERPDVTVIATDSSGDALDAAWENASLHKVSDRVMFRQGNGFTPIMDLAEPFLLVSNPPYIPAWEQLQTDVQDYEPHSALFSGPDGTDVLREIVEQAVAHPQCVGLAMECRAEQATIITA